VDLGGDVIAPGAFSNIDEYIAKGFITFNHEWFEKPIGYIVEAKEDSKGLFIKVAFHDTDEAQECRKIVLERLAAGKFVGLSIGYRTIESSMETRDGEDVRNLKKVAIFETAITIMPMNPEAAVTNAKGLPSLDASHAGVTLDEEIDTVLAAANGLTQRLEEVKALRESDGRDLSEKRISQIGELIERLDALRAKPQEKRTDDRLAVALAIAKGKAALARS
jgi:HK97 family phage prohead protease